MKMLANGLVVLIASLLLGCGASTGSGIGNLTTAGVTGNWQIQSSTNSATSSPKGVLLLGALQSNGNTVNGTFRFTNLVQPDACGLNQVVEVTGTFNSENSLSLSSAVLPNGTTIKIALQILGTQPHSGIGTIEVDGNTCAVASASAIGTQVASMTGTFTGTLLPGAAGVPQSGNSGSATVTLAQSATPGNDGKFSATGTLSYRFGACSASTPLNGSVSGVSVNFWDIIFTSRGQQEVNLTGTTNLPATQIKAAYVLLSPAPCSADPASSAIFNGTFSRSN